MPTDPFEGDLETGWWASDSDWDAVPVPAPWSVAEEAQAMIASTTARLWLSFAEAIGQARATPWEWVPCRPGETSPTARGFAERAVVADIAVRLHLSEATVRTQAHLADNGRTRLPELWRRFSTGQVTAQHLRIALESAAALEGDPLAEFDSRVSDQATEVSAARLRPRARLLAERLNPETLTARHEDAYARRGVWVEPASDGMGWLTAHLPAITAARVAARLTGAAAGLAAADDEERTRDQLRADVLSDLLTGDGTPHAVTATVSATVPVLTLLGIVERPATLDGWSPIDPGTARALVARAPSFTRVLTDPVSSTVLDVDRRSYRPPADLARFVRVRDPECTHPGCGRRATDCDLDHLTPWAAGGRTSAANLHPACPPHHRQKHQTRWTAERDPAGEARWTSPSGFSARPDPPPF